MNNSHVFDAVIGNKTSDGQISQITPFPRYRELDGNECFTCKLLSKTQSTNRNLNYNSKKLKATISQK